jgi:hypothetical protein
MTMTSKTSTEKRLPGIRQPNNFDSPMPQRLGKPTALSAALKI